MNKQTINQTNLEYPPLTMYQMVERIAKKYPKSPAYEFFGSKTSYQSFLKRIDLAAKAFLAAGIKQGDAVTICLPNIPQTLDCFYALNRIGAIANMVHPQSAQKEISFYLNVSNSKMILTVDMFYEKVEACLAETDHSVTILICRIQDELNPILKTGYKLTTGKPYLKFPNTDHAFLWPKFLKRGTSVKNVTDAKYDTNRTSVILYSGGTSGTPKGICLSDYNFNACAIQARVSMDETFHPGLKILSCMPCFHGFGLGINIHTALIYGVCCVLMPTFTIDSYAKILLKKKPNFIAGVPTLFEALLHCKRLEGQSLDFLIGMYCGGDSLSVELKKKIDSFLHEHKSTIQIREGYGLTECVTASCLTPKHDYRPGSIGLPFDDTTYCIVAPGTEDEVPRGQEGEIIITGPTLMLGYLNNQEETAQTLRTLSDGRTWLFTGDLGKMDEDGYVYYSQRIKRMIITNGYNVYPGQLENAIDSYPEVSYSCVIGIPDEHRGKRIKAYIVLKDGVVGDEDCKKKILDHISIHVAKYALPKEIEFRNELPKTLVGKVAFRKLEEENL